MPKALERKLKAEYGAGSAVPYKIMNSLGLMHGSKETEKGRRLERAHENEEHRREMIRAAMRKHKK